MGVTPEEVRRVAELARLDLDPGEIQKLTADLNRILEHVDALEVGEVEGDDPSAGFVIPGAVYSSPDLDSPGSDPLSHPPQAFAPELRDGHFTVPRLASQAGDDGDSEADE